MKESTSNISKLAQWVIWLLFISFSVACSESFSDKGLENSGEIASAENDLLSENDRAVLEKKIRELGAKIDRELSKQSADEDAKMSEAVTAMIIEAHKYSMKLRDDRDIAANGVRDVISKNQSCTFDFQCSWVSLGCPFGCGGIGVKTSKIPIVVDAVANFNLKYGRCNYMCLNVSEETVACIENMCTAIDAIDK